MLKLLPQSTDQILAVKASGTLSHKDYEAFIPLIDAKIKSGDHIYLLADITELTGMTPHALLDDFLAGMKYWWNFEAVAVVGTKSWEKTLSKVAHYMSPAVIEYFTATDSDKAWAWLQGEYKIDHSIK